MRSEKVAEYRAKAHKRALWIFVFIAIVAVIAVYSLSVDKFGISMDDVIAFLSNHISGNIPEKSADYMAWMTDKRIMDSTVPRTIGGIGVGATLAICGAMMQSITRNPLTDPYTIGISSAALFGVAISISYGICIIPIVNGDSDASMIINAFVFAMVPALAIIFVSPFKKMSPTMMILVGIGLMYMFSAFTTFIKYNSEAEDLHEIYEWSIGTLSRMDLADSYPILIGFILILIFGMVVANKINVMTAGDNMSKSLGVNPIRLRVICFMVMSVATAICVCFTGSIGFVGLVAPHIARLFVGSDNKILIPTAAVVGALLVLVSDVAVRLLPGALPVGTITALIGSPLFIYILYRQRKNAAF